MSYQLSFLQAFVGYGFVQSKLFTALKRDRMLKRIQPYLRVEGDIGSIVKRLLEMILLADTGKFPGQIYQKLKLLQQKCLYRNALVLATHQNRQWNQPTIDTPKTLNYQYIWRLRLVTQSSSDCEHGDIFDRYIAMQQCKYWLKKIEIFKKQRVAECEEKLIYYPQLWLVEHNIYQLFKFSAN